MWCTRSSSCSMPPTVSRGFSDEYGSWKTIWIRRWSAREPAGRAATRPSSLISPASSGRSPVSARASVDLPEPDSPTRASASPRCDLQVHPVDGAQHPLLVPEPGGDRAADREPDLQSRRDEQRPGIGLIIRNGPARVTPSVGIDGSGPVIGRLPRRSAAPGTARSAGSAVARPAGSSRSSGIRSVQSSSANPQRGWNRQPAGGLIRLGGEPGIGTSEARTCSTSGAERSSPRV